MSLAQLAGSVSEMRAIGSMRPALLTRPDRRPFQFLVASAACSTWEKSVTSTASGSARPPSFRIAATTASASASLRQPAPTAKPARLRDMAMAWPRPRLAPSTRMAPLSMVIIASLNHAGEYAAGSKQGRAGHISGLAAEQVEACIGHLVAGAGPAQWDGRGALGFDDGDAGVPTLRQFGVETGREGRVDEAGGDDVHTDAMRLQQQRQGSGEVAQAGLAGRIKRGGRGAAQSGDRANDDDGAVFGETRQEGARQEQRRREVDGQEIGGGVFVDALPVGGIEDTRRKDQAVEGAVDARGDCIAACPVAEVRGEPLLPAPVGVRRMSVGADDVASSVDELIGQCAANATGSARD